MTLAEASEEWREAEADYVSSPSPSSGNRADEAFEQMSAIAFQQGYDPAGPLGIVEFVMREIAK